MNSKTQSGVQNEFAKLWREAFGSVPPLGHILRSKFSGNWTRFHALPESKRYAETETERETILHRANILAQECFGEAGKIWLVTPQYGAFEVDDDDLVSRLGMARSMSWVDDSDAPEDRIEIIFYAVDMDWKPASIDWLFTEIAEDKIRAILFDPLTHTVFGPYDGGFDIVSLRCDAIQALESRYRSWMSERSDRL